MKYLVLFCVSRLNTMPHATRMDETSPRELYSGRRIDYQLDLTVRFGEYVQAYNL